ncbi:MAG TPA: holo-ACP synthase [Elusimicrobiota bacterium]|nr:holo-ACP synthase [Elusimicrobiota bacterium]HMZ26760.1 holo-ACP synthase [Elusimicrobiota bacterium]HNA61035.1 holo-ACP synthase [Elusimicrobiota bacterium]HNC75377.1 holo-ACP synthase [Elusimicrobiota bacterium]HND63652.1 holo-ACP synthase [Elusimicrobiota bacterium]
MTPPSLGVDIVEVKRIARLIREPRFLARVFSDREVAYCRAKKNAAQHFAVRFAAKEAVYKALGRAGVAHKDISVKNEPSGKPGVELAPRLRSLESRLTLTLSHTAEHAVAVALFSPPARRR